MADVQARMQVAKESKDMTAMMQLSQEMRSIYAVAVAPDSGSQRKSMVVETTARTVSEPEKGFLESATSGVKGTISGLKEQGSKFIESRRGKPSGRRSAAHNEEAKRYEEKRRKEIERAQAERSQLRHDKRSERRR
ncbi:MAG: hypothetical protein Q9222_000375 [Ikaeria aurantiellina]